MGASWHWVGHGAAGNLRDPRNWSRRRAGVGGAGVPPQGAHIRIDGRTGTGTLRLAEGYYQLQLRGVRIKGMQGGVLEVVLGSGPLLPRSRRWRAWCVDTLQAVRSMRQRAAGPPPVRSKVRQPRPVGPVRYLAPDEWVAGIARGTIEDWGGFLVPVMRGGTTTKYFWVGGTGTWDTSTATHWALTSGGAGSAGVPTTNDDVVFDASSGSGTVTIGIDVEVGQLTMTAYTGTLARGNFQIGVNGSANGNNVTLGASMTDSGTGTLLYHSGVSGTFTTNGCHYLGNLTCGGGASGGTLTLGDTNNLGAMTHTSGTLNTNGKTCIWGAFNGSNANTRTLTMGASPITVTGTATPWTMATTTGLTVTANTATVTCNGAGATVQPGAVNYNGTNFAFTGGGACTWATNTATIGNLTYAAAAGGGNDQLTFSASVTCNTFTVTATATWYVAIVANVMGTQRTITASAASYSNCIFRDIKGAGAAAWTGTTNVGDAGGNTGIAATVAAAQAYVGGTLNYSAPASWTSRRPLPQDPVTVSTAGGTLTVDTTHMGGSHNFTGYTGTLTVTAATGNFHGSLTVGSGMVWNAANVVAALGRGSYSITTHGLDLGSVSFSAPGGSYTLADAFATASHTFTVNNGTLTATANVTANAFSFFAGSTINMGAGTWLFKATNAVVWNCRVGTTVNAQTSTIMANLGGVASSTRTFTGGGNTYYAFVDNGHSAMLFSDSNTFLQPLVFADTTARTVAFPAGGVTMVPGGSFTGAAAQPITVVSTTPGTATTLLVKDGAAVTFSNASASADVLFAATIDPPVATATFGALVPTAGVKVLPPVATVAFAAKVPVAKVTCAPAVGAATFAAYPPHVTITWPAGVTPLPAVSYWAMLPPQFARSNARAVATLDRDAMTATLEQQT